MKAKRRKYINGSELLVFKKNKKEYEFYWHEGILRHHNEIYLALDFRRRWQTMAKVIIELTYYTINNGVPIEYVIEEKVVPVAKNYLHVPLVKEEEERKLWKIRFIGEPTAESGVLPISFSLNT